MAQTRRVGPVDLRPHKIDGTLAFMFDTRLPVVTA